MDLLGGTHFLSAIAAIVSGAAVFRFTRKGTRRHRWWGWAFVACMAVTNISALLIYRLFGTFGPFHVFAIVSLVSVAGGTVAGVTARLARRAGDKRGRAGRIGAHYYFMTYTYVGLLAALVSESATRVPAVRSSLGPGLKFAVTVAVATLAVFAVGTWMIQRRRNASLSPFST